MAAAPEIDSLLEAVSGGLDQALVATDFDGTLAPIIDEPSQSRPVARVFEALERLSAKAGEVAVISGRPVSFLREYLPSELTIVGLYGLEVLKDGEVAFRSNAGVWRETMADVATAAELQGPAGMLVELKGLSITLHYRGHPEIAEQVEQYSEAAAASAGLRRRGAKMSYELHPPIDEDKGTVLTRLAGSNPGAVVFIGDDVGDLPAFDALDALADAGRTVVRVAVAGDEVSAELVDRADLVVDGPEGVLSLIDRLVGHPG